MTDLTVEQLRVPVSLFNITKPREWNINYWTSWCKTIRHGQNVVLTNSHESKERVKQMAADELRALGQVAVFTEESTQ
jgi:hypothetical protein